MGDIGSRQQRFEVLPTTSDDDARARTFRPEDGTSSGRRAPAGQPVTEPPRVPVRTGPAAR